MAECPEEYAASAQQLQGRYVGDSFEIEIKTNRCLSMRGDIQDPGVGASFLIKFEGSLTDLRSGNQYQADATYRVLCFPAFGIVCVNSGNEVWFRSSHGLFAKLNYFPGIQNLKEFEISLFSGEVIPFAKQ